MAYRVRFCHLRCVSFDGRYVVYARIEEPRGDILLVNDFQQEGSLEVALVDC